jgi:hypothetical protein
MKTLLKTFVILFISLLTIACNKDDDAIQQEPVTQLKDIYICGKKGNYAAYWKNGIENLLSDGTRATRANEIIVNGTDVYVRGYEIVGGVIVPKFWKNTVLTTLPSEILGDFIFDVEGSDTYLCCKSIATTGRDAITIWKNGVKTIITDGTKNAVPIGIEVVGSDVYVLGYEGIDFNERIHKVWKNGIITTILTDGTFNENASKMKVIGNDIYIIGRTNALISGLINSCPTVWKNGARTQFTNSLNAYFSDVNAIGNDSFIVGADFSPTSEAKIWKNGIATVLQDGTEAISIAGVGSDVYVVGFKRLPDGNREIILWKNNTVLNKITNPSIDTNAASIFLTTN